MELGSKFVYLGNTNEDEEEVIVDSVHGVDVVCSESDDDDDDDGEVCLLDILDTAGQEEYSAIRDAYVNSADGFVIIYSITDKSSFSEAKSIFSWLQRLKTENSFAILVANKQDLFSEAEVTSKEGKDLAETMKVPFFETSAKLGTGVVESFTGLVRTIPRKGTDYKIVMLGGAAVGKSSITLRFVSNTFMEDYDPTIEDSYRKMMRVQGLKRLNKEALKDFKGKKKSIDTNAKLRPESTPMAHKFESSNIIVKGISQIFNRQRRSQLSERSSVAGLHVPDQEAADAALNSQRRKVKEKKTDGNAVLIPLKILEEEPRLVTGDAIKCAGCSAVLTSTAVLKTVKDTKEWTCEFCYHKNSNLAVSENEIPTGDSFDFMLSPPTKQCEDSTNAGAENIVELKKGKPQGVTIYCMDISGSMDGTCHVPESHVAWREERTHGAETVSRVTRLRCIKKAIQRLTEQTKEENPGQQVLLTCFSDAFYVKAGGNIEILPTFQQLQSESFNGLIEKGHKLSVDYPLQTIEQSHTAIDEAVERLQTVGSTALGPALTICVGYAKDKPGSEVILCTDGLPNSGIGNLQTRPADTQFYKTIGDYALSKNITINILAVGDSSSDLQTVSSAASISGGLTTRLNPVEIIRQLRLISQNEIIATSVSVRFYLHPDFVFDEIDFGENLSRLVKEVGNVRKETVISFRFKMKDPAKHLQLSNVPFQVQITYTRKDGMTCLRVLTKSFQATNDRKEMEANINVSVLGVTTMQSTAKMAQANDPRNAQHQLKNMKRLIRRGAHTEEQMEERLAFKNEVETWDKMLATESHNYLQNCIDDSAYSFAANSKAVPTNKFRSAQQKMNLVRERKATKGAISNYNAYKDNL